ncbi:endonuclease/exonuclease/phosphatase family protein [Tautonia rosea]|uniref:endonuclease/exonuclease/phosphatase family protein n=1 Tax=Tautonia rosea TaxID=2728037 RepID=UPI001475A0CC|nr:endonuclease/exonuclease/phosphatase family protein [Tautonia rosea]
MSLPLIVLVISFMTGPLDEPPEMRVMSFNIRYGTAGDGKDAWEHRKDLVIETIKTFSPDLLGTQETLAFQRDFLATKLPEYSSFSAGRDDGREQGEMMAVFYRTDRFQVIDSGHFWLSETPDQPGSTSWDSSLPRMVTWLKLRDLQNADSLPVALFNTHFDHRGEMARLESARLLRRMIAKLAPIARVVVTGDFNCAEGSPPYQAIFVEDSDTGPNLIDTYRAAHPEHRSDEGTYSGFRADASRGPRIDWIACSDDWKIRSAAIDRSARNGRTPSDHFPVTAILTLPSE